MKAGLLCLVALLIILATHYTVARQIEEKIGSDTNNCRQQQSSAVVAWQQHRDDDARIQQLALTTLTAMAHSLVNIGIDPHNMRIIASNLVNIVSIFVHFIVAAMRHPDFFDYILEEDEFQGTVVRTVMRALKEHMSVEHGQGFSQEGGYNEDSY